MNPLNNKFDLGYCFSIKQDVSTELFQRAYEIGILPGTKFKIIHKDIFNSLYVITQGISCFMIGKEELIELIK